VLIKHRIEPELDWFEATRQRLLGHNVTRTPISNNRRRFAEAQAAWGPRVSGSV